ncbi:MAG: phosphodiesterase [Pikeienuella sp.]
MTKVIWLSDLHFTADGDVIGHDPRRRVSAAVEMVNELHGDAACVIISGDLVNRGTEADYAALKDHLDRLNPPYHVIPGNHDDRALMRAVFGLSGDFIQHVVELPDARLICLDTHKPRADGGEYCAARHDWLAATLASSDVPAYLFMHHPPMPLGLPMQDQDMMADGGAFLDLVSRFPQVRHLFIGHVHRPISGAVRGIPFATMRAVLYQAPAPWPEWDWESFAPGQEPPGLGVIHIDGGDVILHHAQICAYEDGTG